MQQTKLPRWRGFNLLGGFLTNSPGYFEEEDFRWIGEWGFDFVRLPLNYTFWIDDDNPFKINETKLEFVDEALRWADKYGLHVELNLHRAPGYSVAEDRQEPFSLWSDADAEEAFRLHWTELARRYQAVSADKLSFNLLNEPSRVEEEVHNRAVLPTIRSIAEITPERRIILDGMNWGNEPIRGILQDTQGLNVHQSCRFYAPHPLTHHQAEWASPDPEAPTPSWPLTHRKSDGEIWNRERIFEGLGLWAKFAEDNGIGVHCGEGGAYNKTPHAVVLAWMEDCLDAMKTYNIGYALWNFKGPFGILDSDRIDAVYEDFHGHKLDRKMLDLLRKY